MQTSKAQADIVTSVLVIIIALGLAATAYTWGIPLIQKQQDTAVVERVSNFFNQNNANSLPSRIEFVANNGGDQTFTLDVRGIWIVHPCPEDELSSCNPSTDDIANGDYNSIEFRFFSKISNIAAGEGFVSLTPGASCPPAKGILGKDKSSVVCAKADAVLDGYDMTYKVWFRELEETGSRGFQIDLVKHESGLYSSTGKSLRISRQSIHEISPETGKTLIIPEIKILLE